MASVNAFWRLAWVCSANSPLAVSQCCFVLLPLFFHRPGEGLTDGVARYFGQVVVFGDVLDKQFVLADNPGD